MTLTMKFGGTSVGSVAALRRLTGIINDLHPENGLVLVASAMSGVTDMLQAGIFSAAAGDSAGHHTIGRALREQHQTVLRDLAPDEQAAVWPKIDALIEEYVQFCDSVYVLREATPRALDYTMGIGERMSVRQIAAVLRQAGLPAQAVDATALITTDDRFGNAAPFLEQTEDNVERVLFPLLNRGEIPVVTGFIGSTPDGIQTTLGRGGSDYSAAIIGASLPSDEVWIWTDVDGVMSADPRVVPDAQTIDVLTYREVSELAYYGAKVLHPKTIRPVLDAGIPIRVKNTFNPDADGTLIVPNDADDATTQPIRAVTAVKDIGLITIEGKGMLGVPGIAARTFSAVAETGTSVLLISQSSSEQSICFMVRRESTVTVTGALEAEFEREIERRDIDSIGASDPLTIITVVGSGMLSTPGVAAQVFAAVADAGINVVVIAHGSSDCSLSFAVGKADGERAVRAIHALM